MRSGMPNVNLLILCNNAAMKPKTPEYVEGPEAWERFTAGMRKALSVPHSEIQRRVEAHRRAAAQNPHKRGPKPKNG